MNTFTGVSSDPGWKQRTGGALFKVLGVIACVVLVLGALLVPMVRDARHAAKRAGSR